MNLYKNKVSIAFFAIFVAYCLPICSMKKQLVNQSIKKIAKLGKLKNKIVTPKKQKTILNANLFSLKVVSQCLLSGDDSNDIAKKIEGAIKGTDECITLVQEEELQKKKIGLMKSQLGKAKGFCNLVGKFCSAKKKKEKQKKSLVGFKGYPQSLQGSIVEIKSKLETDDFEESKKEAVSLSKEIETQMSTLSQQKGFSPMVVAEYLKQNKIYVPLSEVAIKSVYNFLLNKSNQEQICKIEEECGGSSEFLYEDPDGKYLLFGNIKAGEKKAKKAISLYELSLKAFLGASKAFKEGDLCKLDPDGKDNACQVRASKTLELYQNKEIIIGKISFIESLVEDKLNKLSGLGLPKGCESLLVYLKANDLFVGLDDDLQYLTCCFLRSENTGIKILVGSCNLIFDKEYQNNGGLEDVIIQKLINYAIEYLQSTALSLLQKAQGETLTKELIAGVKQIDGTNGKKSCPNFFAVMTLLLNDLVKKNYICIRSMLFCPSEMCQMKKSKKEFFWFYEPNEASDVFKLLNAQEILEKISSDTPVMVVEGWAFDGSFDEFGSFVLGKNNYTFKPKDYGKILKASQKYGAKATSFGSGYCETCKDYATNFEEADLLNDIFLPNEAQHKQFPGGKEYKMIKKNKELIKDADKIEIDFSELPELKKLYDSSIEKSKENGAGRENMSLFLIDHIYPCLVNNLGFDEALCNGKKMFSLKSELESKKE